MTPDLLRWLHIVLACLFAGAAAGSAGFVVPAWRGRDPAVLASVLGGAVAATLWGILPGLIGLPVTGIWLAGLVGWSDVEAWINWSASLHAGISIIWIGLVFLLIRWRRAVEATQQSGGKLPPRMGRVFAVWLTGVVLASVLTLTVVWLMIARPAVIF